MVLITPSSMPKFSFNTLAIGAKQFVVQLALDTILCSAFKPLSFTPKTTV